MPTLCPVCQSIEFDAFSGRLNARCTKCGSLERGRLSWMILERLGLLTAGTKVLNCAPEPFMLFFGAPILGESYFAADYSPEIFAKYKKTVHKIDLCSEMTEYADRMFDVIMHNHVLEHVPCEVSRTLTKLNKLLAPGGFHLFSVPILANSMTLEDLNPNISPEERRKRFGQDDHVRIFGDLDFMALIQDAGMIDDMIDVSKFISPHDLEIHGIPPDTLTKLSGHRVFVYKSPI